MCRENRKRINLETENELLILRKPVDKKSMQKKSHLGFRSFQFTCKCLFGHSDHARLTTSPPIAYEKSGLKWTREKDLAVWIHSNKSKQWGEAAGRKPGTWWKNHSATSSEEHQHFCSISLQSATNKRRMDGWPTELAILPPRKSQSGQLWCARNC